MVEVFFSPLNKIVSSDPRHASVRTKRLSKQGFFVPAETIISRTTCEKETPFIFNSPRVCTFFFLFFLLYPFAAVYCTVHIYRLPARLFTLSRKPHAQSLSFSLGALVTRDFYFRIWYVRACVKRKICNLLSL